MCGRTRRSVGPRRVRETVTSVLTAVAVPLVYAFPFLVGWARFLIVIGDHQQFSSAIVPYRSVCVCVIIMRNRFLAFTI